MTFEKFCFQQSQAPVTKISRNSARGSFNILCATATKTATHTATHTATDTVTYTATHTATR